MSLKAKEPTKDLGEIKLGQVYNFEYEIENTLPTDVKIDKVQTSCSSCTSAKIDSSIKGNSTNLLKVTFTPGVLGQTTKRVSIMYDKGSVLVVDFKGVVNG